MQVWRYIHLANYTHYNSHTHTHVHTHTLTPSHHHTLTGALMITRHDSGRNFPEEAGKTPMSCSRGRKGVVPVSKSFLRLPISWKSEAKGA